MADTYDNDSPRLDPLFMAPPPAWWEGCYEIRVEPFTPDYLHVAVSARYVHGPASVIIASADAQSNGGPQALDQFAGALRDWEWVDRAVAMAIWVCSEAMKGEVRA